MKKLSFFKKAVAIMLIGVIAAFVVGCNEAPPTISDLKDEAHKISKESAESNYKRIVTLMNERADLVPNFMEEEKDHTTLKFSEEAYNDVLAAREAVKAAKTIEETANACTTLDEAIINWTFAVNSTNPKASSDHCYAALCEKITKSSKTLMLVIENYNNSVKTYNSSVSAEKDKLKAFNPPASDLIAQIG